MRNLAIAVMALIGLAGCAVPTGPVEVTRFVEPSARDRLGRGTVFIETAPGDAALAAELLAYKAAVARELTALGYTEAPRDRAGQVAQVRLSSSIVPPADARGPVSVGVGGSTGSYGSGVGVGIGLNLGGGAREELATRLEVRLNDALTGQSLWEGRAVFTVARGSILADRAQNASVMADALFREFPGNNGETIAVPVAK